jgi:hypothetical protein
MLVYLPVMGDTVGRLQSLFSVHQLDVLIGSMLGDGRLECRSQGIRGSKTARYRVHQGYRQKEYVAWKYEVMKAMTSTGPRAIVRYDYKRGIAETSFYFHTQSLQELGELHSYFYRGTRKIVPQNIGRLLSPRALAVWFMDDGSNNGNSYTLNTHGFSLGEQDCLRNFLKAQYGIHASVVKDRKKYKIYIGASQHQKLRAVIEPFITPSMKYKIVYPSNDLSPAGGRATYHNGVANTSVPSFLKKLGKGIV